MSPRRTFQNCGSSSRLVFRSTRPIDVTRGSSAILKKPLFPASPAEPLDLMNELTN
jgi:hypothetical protein